MKRNSSRAVTQSQKADMLSPHSAQSRCFFSSMLAAEVVIDQITTKGGEIFYQKYLVPKVHPYSLKLQQL